MEIKIELIKVDGIPVSVGAGRFCFSIEGGSITHNESSRIGCQVVVESGVGDRDAIKKYDEAFDLATFAWENQIFDAIINN
jgi:hypothetical protein